MKVLTTTLAGRTFLLVGLSVLLVLFCWEVFGDELSVIDVRKNIPLSDTDPVYRDYYISLTNGVGLKKNQVVTAVRKTLIKDASGANSFGEIEIPVGTLRIIAVSGKIAIAREYKLISREDTPMLEQLGIMVGDRIELTDSVADAKKGK